MSKLPKKNQFLDLSDYGRPMARVIANALKNTPATPIHVTLGFIVSGLLAIVCMLQHQYFAAAFFLVLKSVLDAADGELARVKNTPSYTGRYLDSVADIILNLLFFLTICYLTSGSIFYALLAFCGVQLQGTLYNYYHLILREKWNGDNTSRIFEDVAPIAMEGEKQSHVNILFGLYHFFYSIFDKIIYNSDKAAIKDKHLPDWFMTAVSTFGLGFQLLIFGLMLIFHWERYIIPFFIVYSFFIPVFISLRKWIDK